VAVNLVAGGHNSFIYLGRGLTTTTTPADAIIIYEPLTNNFGEGMSVLFGDGHVEFVDVKFAAALVSKAATGKYPVTMPTLP
jgi:prepilin-type processing-associated H-X9-DG protein